MSSTATIEPKEAVPAMTSRSIDVVAHAALTAGLQEVGSLNCLRVV